MRAPVLSFLPMVLLAACQPSPFAQGEKADQSYAMPVSPEENTAFAGGAVRYRIQNIRTLPFTVWNSTTQARQVYLLRETQRMVTNSSQETGLDSSEIDTAVFAQSPNLADADLRWKKNFRADRAELLTTGTFPLYRLIKFGGGGTLDRVRYVNAVTGATLGAGASELAPVTLTDATGDATRYITVQPDLTERGDARPASEAAIVTLASADGALSSVRLLAPQAAPGETSLLQSFEGKKIVRVNPNHDKAAVLLHAANGETIRLPFDRKNFLPDRAKLPTGWRVQQAPNP